MHGATRRTRTVVIFGLVTMLLGAIDPLEGSLLIVLGTGLVALGAHLGRSRSRTFIDWSFALVAVGVGAMWVLSAWGGIGGSTGRSTWWGLVILPYPAGWILGLVGAIRALREVSGPAAPSGAR